MNRHELDLQIKNNKLDAVLITSDYNRTWFTNFISTAGYLIVSKKQSTIFLDGRYVTAGKEQIKNTKIMLLKQYSDFIDWMLKQDFKRVGIEADYLQLEVFSGFKKSLPKIEFVPLNGASFRSVKTEEEIKIIKKACSISLAAIEKVKHLIKPGISELEIRNQLEFEFRKNGADKAGFDSIVVSGPNSALPHGKPTSKKLKEGELVTIDCGAQYRGYMADITRTFKVGKIKNKTLNEIYDIVKEAQKRGIEAIKPGVKTVEIDRICRDYIKDKGYSEYFTHGTGHGLGIEVHEKPVNSQTSNETLQEGNVVTVEPGIYIPGVGGVRIEDDILVTKKGYKILSR